MVDGLRERIEDWDRRSVEDGLAGLATLAEEEFDGVVTAGSVTVTFVSGRVLHCDGDLDDVDDAPLTVRVAPSPELALLVAMNATGGETQAQYYTEDTDVESVDERLQSGGFTGYVELAENVLSGSYYRLYYGGTARSLAFVGTNDRVLTGAEAFDRTLDEVGIYEVVPVELSVTDVPEPPEPADGSTGRDDPASGDDPAATSGPAAGADGPDAVDNDDAISATDVDGNTAAGTDATQGTTAEDGPAKDQTGGATAEDATVGPDATAQTDRATDAVEAGGATGSTDDVTGVSDDPATQDATEDVDDETAGTIDGTASRGSAREGAGQSDRQEDAASEAATTWSTGQEEPVGADTADASESDPGESSTASDTTPADSDEGGHPRNQGTPSGDDRLEELVERVATLERRLERLQTGDESVSSVDSGDGNGGAGSAERSPADVLEDTDCLVRYETRAGATIEDLLDGDATTDAVRENLRIETNTTFDADATTVDGIAFEAFLEASLERRVVGWLLCELPSEIVATDSRGALGDLVEALPTIDRIGFQETVDLEEFGDEPLEEESPESAGFDLVAWDTDGYPRVVADLRRSTDPVGEGPISSLIARGKAVASRTDLATALFATDGYYDADARRAVEATTGGGILARDSRASYVKMTRKRGFHCCLAEAYDEAIHLTVPEL
jgi:hypothetical protein